MPTAYILVNCTMGAEENIINEVAKLSDVKEVRGTYGVHDIFVKVRSDNTERFVQLLAGILDYFSNLCIDRTPCSFLR
jgi:DNA-binding Lrp family transcriptional regulator